MKVSLIGIGMEGDRTLTREAEEAIGRAELLIGARRMLAPFAHLKKRQIACYDSEKIAALLKEEEAAGTGTAAVLFSGDTGFFSGARKLRAYLEILTPASQIEMLPGISTLSCLCARTGISCENVKIVSLHGREGNPAVQVLRNEKTFFLLGGSVTPAELCKRLCEYALSGVNVFVGADLGTENEEVIAGTAEELCELKTGSLAASLVLNPQPLSYLPCGIDDEAFLRVLKQDGGRTIPMTKAEVRAIAAAKLKICADDVCWDAGCGTGSVSVEMALRCPDGTVYGFDRDEAACELTMRNARKFSCDNLRTVCCEFPPEAGEQDKIMSAIPAPDALFIGGGGGRIGEIIAFARDLNPQVRIVITAVTMETIEEARAALTASYGDCAVTQLMVSRVGTVGRVSMLKALNPVFILSSV